MIAYISLLFVLLGYCCHPFHQLLVHTVHTCEVGEYFGTWQAEVTLPHVPLATLTRKILHRMGWLPVLGVN